MRSLDYIRVNIFRLILDALIIRRNDNIYVHLKDAVGIICFSHIMGFGLSLAEKMVYAE